MGIRPQQYVPDINYGWYAPSLPKPEGPGLLSAAFRQENDVYNLIDYFSRPTFAPDPNFDHAERAKESPNFLLNPQAFMGVQSEAEWMFREAKIEKERKDRAAIAAGGAAGIAAALMAGVLSPTILLPAGGAVVGGKTVARGAAEGAMMVALGASIQEGVLHLNQDERTVSESLIGIGAGVALGALLGGAVQYATNAEIKAIQADMADPHRIPAISPSAPPSAVGLSAEATAAENLPGTITPFTDPEGIAATAIPISVLAKKLHLPEAVVEALSVNWLGPVTRGLASKSAVRRSVTAQLANAGLYTDAALKGIAVAEEGSVEQLVKQHYYAIAKSTRELNKIFTDWFVNTGKGSRFRTYFPTHSYKDFLEQTGEVMFEHIQGLRRAEVPEELHNAADVVLNVYKQELKTAQESGLNNWVQLRDETYQLQIATQRLRRDLVNQDYNSVRHIMIEHAREVLKSHNALEDVSDDIVAIVGKGSKKEALTEEDFEITTEAIVDALLPRLLGEYGRHGGVDILNEIGEKAAKFIYIDPTRVWSNGRSWKEFLDRDVETLTRSFIRSMAPDVELYRKFKTVTPDVPDNKVRIWQDFAKEQESRRAAAENLPEKERQAALVEIAKESQDFQRDMTAMVNRLRHRWGMPADPSSFAHRAGKMALQLNTMRLMGGVVIASFADLARITMRVGFMKTFKHGVIPMLRDFKNFKMRMMEVKYAGTALDVLMHGRSGAMFDLFDELEYGNLFERAMQYGTSRVGIVAMFDYWNSAMKQFSGAVWLGTLAEAIDAADRGALTKWQRTMLAAANIDEATAKKMADLTKRGGGGTEVRPGVWMPNTEDWSEVSDEEIEAALRKQFGAKYDELAAAQTKEFNLARHRIFTRSHKQRRSLQRNFRAALAQLVDTTIVTPGIERPNWVDGSTPGRLIAQFRSFTLTSTIQVARLAGQDARAGNMAPVILGSAFSLALGALSYYTWAQSTGGRSRQKMLNELDAALSGDSKAMRRWADEAFNRSGLMGVLSEAQKFAERVPGLAPYATFAGVAPTRSPYVSPFFDAFGPTGNIVDNLDHILMTYDDPTSSTFRSFKQLMPYQNLMFIRQYFDKLNDQLMRSVGVSPE